MEKKFDLGTFVNILIISSIAVIIAVISVNHTGRLEASPLLTCDRGWHYEDGAEVDLRDLRYGSNIIITRAFEKEEISEKALCFRAKNVLFSVSVGGSVLYDFDPKYPSIYGKSTGMFVHYVSIPNKSDRVEVTIRYTNIYNDSSCYFSNMCIGTSGEYIRHEFYSNIPKASVSVFMFMIGMILEVFAVILGKYIGRSRTATIFLGIFATLAAVWTATETMIPQLVCMDPAAVHFINYMILITIPHSAIMFVSVLTENEKTPLVPIVCIITVSNLFLNIISTVTGGYDYHELLRLTHAVLFFTISCAFYMTVTSIIKKRTEKLFLRSMGGSFLVILIMGLIDLVRYSISKGNNDTAFFLRIGLLIFVAVMGIYTLRDLIVLSNLGHKAAIMRKLAYNDALTGFNNRTAFAECEKDINDNMNGTIFFVQLDINDLKLVNDNYGHSEGDRHIIAASRVIRESFGRIGSCYRTGGDEFVAVIQGKNQDEIKKAEQRFDELISEYNSTDDPPVKLAIAYGISKYEVGEDNPEKAEKEADKRMYEMKKRMKSDS